jgi:hypothetical protein
MGQRTRMEMLKTIALPTPFLSLRACRKFLPWWVRRKRWRAEVTMRRIIVMVYELVINMGG